VIKVEKLLLSPEEAAEVLGVARSTIYDLIRMRLLTSVKIGRRRLIPMQACRDMVERMVEESA
jgi:excisionase family DNA binding protein